jgi:hypothetical protein
MRSMKDSQWGLIDGPSIPRLSVTENDFPELRRPAIDVATLLLGWLTILLFLAGPATAAYMTFLELPVGPGLFVLQAIVTLPALVAWAVAAWFRDQALAKLWAKEKGFTIRSCSLTAEEADAISERCLPMTTRDRRVVVCAEGDPRGSYRGVLLISRPLFGARGFRFRYIAVGYSN